MAKRPSPRAIYSASQFLLLTTKNWLCSYIRGDAQRSTTAGRTFGHLLLRSTRTLDALSDMGPCFHALPQPPGRSAHDGRQQHLNLIVVVATAAGMDYLFVVFVFLCLPGLKVACIATIALSDLVFLL
jgi:hypothetical protein